MNVDRDVDAERFAQAFRHVWQAISDDVREAIVEHWDATVAFGRPIIEYSNDWRPTHKGVYATAGAGRGEIQFVARLLDPMPDGALKFVVAHELAHFYQRTLGDEPHFSPDGQFLYYRTSNGHKRPRHEYEAEASEFADSWGFPRAPLTSWENEQP